MREIIIRATFDAQRICIAHRCATKIDSFGKKASLFLSFLERRMKDYKNLLLAIHGVLLKPNEERLNFLNVLSTNEHDSLMVEEIEEYV